MKKIAVIALLLSVLTGCASVSRAPDGEVHVRTFLNTKVRICDVQPEAQPPLEDKCVEVETDYHVSEAFAGIFTGIVSAFTGIYRVVFGGK